MKQLLNRIREKLSSQRGTRVVAWDDTGFEVREHRQLLARVQWQAIREIFAYKEDLVTLDDICLGFRLRHDGSFCSVSEEFEGYAAFLAHLEHRFDGMRTGWFPAVAFPAFAPNRTTLWGEPLPNTHEST